MGDGQIYETFKPYEERLFRELDRDDHPNARRRYLERVRSVMSDKYRLTDKFALIAATLSPESADEDVAHWSDTLMVDFESLQKVEFIHPDVEANIAQEEAREAVDCMQDEGLFDFGC
jgi:hypothetical protein